MLHQTKRLVYIEWQQEVRQATVATAVDVTYFGIIEQSTHDMADPYPCSCVYYLSTASDQAGKQVQKSCGS